MTGPTTAWQDISSPPQDSVAAPWWDATREHRLLLQRCTTCSAIQHPPRSVCVACMTDALDWTEASGVGVIDSFTVIHRAPNPDVAAPYVLARVRLAEGPILLTRIEVDITTDHPVHCDQSVVLTWASLSDGRALPVFKPNERPHPIIQEH